MQARLLMHHVAATATAATCVAAIFGCAAATNFNDPEFGVAASQGVTLAVVNRNLEDVRVHLLRGSTPVPVGTVGAMQSRSFRVSRAELGSSRVLRLSVVATPSRARIAMIPVDVEPGQTVEAWIATNLRHSNVQILPQLL